MNELTTTILIVVLLIVIIVFMLLYISKSLEKERSKEQIVKSANKQTPLELDVQFSENNFPSKIYSNLFTGPNTFVGGYSIDSGRTVFPAQSKNK